MQEIASEAGVHRATVHRHFASRDDLVAAVRLRAVDASVEAFERALAHPPSRGADAVEAATAAVLASGDTYRLYRYTTWRDEFTLARGQALGERLAPLVTAGQQQGDLRSDLDVEALMTAWGGLVTAVMPKIADGELTVAEAAGFIRTMLAPSG